jgi:hypothetical protein
LFLIRLGTTLKHDRVTCTLEKIFDKLLVRFPTQTTG